MSGRSTDYLKCPKRQKITVDNDNTALDGDFDIVGEAERMLALAADDLVTA